MATESVIDEYDELNFAVNTALVHAFESLNVAFEQYEALEDIPFTRIEINGYGAEMLDDLAVALHRDFRTGLGYCFEQPGLRAASELAQTAADALREYASGAVDSRTYLAELCHDLLAFELTPEVSSKLALIAHLDATSPAGGGGKENADPQATADRRPSAA